MSERYVHRESDDLDLEFEELFASFEGLHASDELKASTLDAIFAAAGSEDAPEASSPEEHSTTPDFSLVEEVAPAVPTKPHRMMGWRLRVAAAIVAISLGVGGVAYAVPSSHVVVTQDDATVDLGVNVFGVAVTVDTDNEELKELLNEVRVRNTGYEEALSSVLDVCEQRGADTDHKEATVVVNASRDERGDAMTEGVNRLMEERATRREEGAQDAPQVTEERADDVSEDAGLPVGGEAPEMPEGQGTGPVEQGRTQDSGMPASSGGAPVEEPPR